MHSMNSDTANFFFSGLEWLDSAVFALTETGEVLYANPAAEQLLECSRRDLLQRNIQDVLHDAEPVLHTLQAAIERRATVREHEISLGHPEHPLQVSVIVAPIEHGPADFLLELRQLEKQLKIANEERLLAQQQANRELIRNLAHEIKNPLGGIRGAAQLLEHELPDPNLKEYTQVIRSEAERLQSLIDRLLTPHRLPRLAELNIHEVLERVRSVTLAEHRQALTIQRDYDTSLPLLWGDKEQLIQVTLNIVRNACQALQGVGHVVLRTRIARQVTIARKRHRLAIQVQIIDNGPGIPDSIRDRIFYPLVSGRPDGHGVGLMLAQTYIQQHGGSIDFDSRPGSTCFSLLIPIQTPNQDDA